MNIKQKAIRLRKLGKSYNEINAHLKIPKSTLSSWLKNLEISQNIKNKNISHAKKIWAKNITRYNIQRAEKIHSAGQKLQSDSSDEIKEISEHELKLIGIALYWAEGYKRGKWYAMFCNSDPHMVKIMMKFFRVICKVPEEKFRPQVQTHPNISIEDAEHYWSKISSTDRSLFRKPLIQVSISSKGKRPYNRLPYGTFRIGIADVKILHKLKGWIHGLSHAVE